MPDGSRVLTPGGNLLQAWGLAPLQSYRTLDVPLPIEVQQAFAQPMVTDWKRKPFKILGLDAIVQHSVVVDDLAQIPDGFEVFDDDAIQWWQSGDSKLLELYRAREKQVVTALQRQQTSTSLALLYPQRVLQKSHNGWKGVLNNAAVASASDVTATSESELPMSWQVDASEPSVLVVSRLSLPGWKATVLSSEAQAVEPVVSLDDYWQGIELAPGSWTVSVHYEPPGWKVGILASGTGASLSLLLIVVAYWKRRM